PGGGRGAGVTGDFHSRGRPRSGRCTAVGRRGARYVVPRPAPRDYRPFPVTDGIPSGKSPRIIGTGRFHPVVSAGNEFSGPPEFRPVVRLTAIFRVVRIPPGITRSISLRHGRSAPRCATRHCRPGTTDRTVHTAHRPWHDETTPGPRYPARPIPTAVSAPRRPPRYPASANPWATPV